MWPMRDIVSAIYFCKAWYVHICTTLGEAMGLKELCRTCVPEIDKKKATPDVTVSNVVLSCVQLDRWIEAKAEAILARHFSTNIPNLLHRPSALHAVWYLWRPRAIASLKIWSNEHWNVDFAVSASLAKAKEYRLGICVKSTEYLFLPGRTTFNYGCWTIWLNDIRLNFVMSNNSNSRSRQLQKSRKTESRIG
jgi:hypothetical protein